MTDTDQLVTTASEKIGAMGSAFYFTEPAVGKGEELGLGTFRFYILGRGGVLGDVDASIVSSAFGYFAPHVIRTQWDKARSIVDPRTAGREYFECCGEFGRMKLSGLEGLDALCDALGAVNDAADPAGLALYAGISGEPLADDAPARAMQLVAVLREFRGSAHLAAVIGALLEPRIAHFMRRPDFFGAFGYADDDKPEVTDEHRAKLAAADEVTDAMVARAYSVLDDAQRAALLDGLGAMERALAG
ncbi:MAG: SCO6745 family protein [Acidimicrobiales bacterium]